MPQWKGSGLNSQYQKKKALNFRAYSEIEQILKQHIYGKNNITLYLGNKLNFFGQKNTLN